MALEVLMSIVWVIEGCNVNKDYERVINKLKLLYECYYDLMPRVARMDEKIRIRSKIELIEKIFESENIEVTKNYE